MSVKGVAVVAACALLCVVASAQGAATARYGALWKNCETQSSGVRLSVTFLDPARSHGPGRYVVKKTIKWQALIGTGRWSTYDSLTTQTSWFTVNNVNWDFTTMIGDRTAWAGAYDRRWRAVVTFKLIKNRPGPKDKQVEKLERFPHKGMFAEAGNCQDGVPRELPTGRNGK